METGVFLPVASLLSGRFSDGFWFLDWLARNGHRYWQVLPLNPRDDFGSPYNSPDSLGIDSEYGAEKEWQKLKQAAHERGIKIIGDLPYFISRREKQDLFIKGLKAGAPPDQYNKRGQRWGLPVYDWENKFDQNLAYLLRRVARSFELFDILRLDHFRGYDAIWVYPPKSWLTVPGERIMRAVKNKFPDKIFIAEDLGVITEEVVALRRRFGFLGMKVLVWDNPAEIEADSVVYTSVHDSSPLRGVFSEAQTEKLIDQARQSPAKILIYAAQDLLGLGEEARLNKPGRKKGNWRWKIEAELFNSNI